MKTIKSILNNFVFIPPKNKIKIHLKLNYANQYVALRCGGGRAKTRFNLTVATSD